MHVLSLPPAFALSQDQTLTLKRKIRPITYILRRSLTSTKCQTLHSAKHPSVSSERRTTDRHKSTHARAETLTARTNAARVSLPQSNLSKNAPVSRSSSEGKQKTARQSRRPVPPLVRRWLSARSTSAAGADEPGYTATHPARQPGCSKKFRPAAPLPCFIGAPRVTCGSRSGDVTPQSRHATSRQT